MDLSKKSSSYSEAAPKLTNQYQEVKPTAEPRCKIEEEVLKALNLLPRRRPDEIIVLRSRMQMEMAKEFHKQPFPSDLWIVMKHQSVVYTCHLEYIKMCSQSMRVLIEKSEVPKFAGVPHMFPFIWNIDLEVMKYFLSFLYAGEVKVPYTMKDKILEFGLHFGVESLRDRNFEINYDIARPIVPLVNKFDELFWKEDPEDKVSFFKEHFNLTNPEEVSSADEKQTYSERHFKLHRMLLLEIALLIRKTERITKQKKMEYSYMCPRRRPAEEPKMSKPRVTKPRAARVARGSKRAGRFTENQLVAAGHAEMPINLQKEPAEQKMASIQNAEVPNNQQMIMIQHSVIPSHHLLIPSAEFRSIPENQIMQPNQPEKRIKQEVLDAEEPPKKIRKTVGGSSSNEKRRGNKYKKYSAEDMSAALTAIEDGRETIASAAAKFNIPPRTLYDRKARNDGKQNLWLLGICN